MIIFTRRSSEIPSQGLFAVGSTRSWAAFPILATLLFLAFASPSERELPRRGKDFALFIAVNSYQYWGKLYHPIGEVEKIATELHQHYDFDTLILRNPTQEQIVTALRNYNAKAYPDNGQLLIYLSGHGEFDNLTKEGFFIPREGRLNDVAQTSYLSFSRLRDLVGNIPCNHILLAIDACYSGTFDKLVATRGDISFGRPGAISDERERFITRELTLRSRIFVASGKKEQTPDASNFAAYFLKALRSGGGDDAIVSIQELEAELIKAQPKPHISVFGDHQRESNFLFIKNLSATVAPTTIHNARQDKADWEEAQRLNTAPAYRAYLSKQPNGDFRALAEQKAQTLEAEDREITAWNAAKTLNTCDAYKTFLRNWPQSAYRPLAEEAEKRLCAPPTPNNMALIRGGTFNMGCTSEQKDCGSDESPVTRVTVSDFYLGKYELTVKDFQQFINATSYKTDADRDGGSYIWTGSSWEKKSGVNWKCDVAGNVRPSSEYEHPVIHVSWNDAIAYCNWRSEKEGLTKAYTISGSNVTANWNANGYRLPTEAEWEYAARGGGRAVLFGNGKDIADPREINFDASASYKKPYSVAGEYRQKTVPVGSLNSPNALGLHDMSGNVWEWCWDWHGNYSSAAQTNPKGPSTGSYRVLRGGSWHDYPQYCRVVHRLHYTPGHRSSNTGFRLARTL